MILVAHALLIACAAAAQPRKQLECGAEVRGTIVRGGDVHAFEGIPYAEPPTGALRFSPPIDIASCDEGTVVEATSPPPVCTQAATPGLNLPMSFMVLQLSIYLLPVLTLIFGICTARAVWTQLDDAEQYADLEQPKKQRSVWSSRVIGCGLGALLPALLLLALPAWVWSGMLGDEDCLFLNVYTPAAAAAEPRAVMVWIHGGAYVAGSSRLDDMQYGSSLEMVGEDVVHVTLNYRLGAFGFLFLGEGWTANRGLQDQQAALRWVQRHIRSFGGDPNQVLVYGHSAGGESVLALQRMRSSAGLFRAAAALSPMPKIGTHPASAAAAWRDLIRSTGCAERLCLLKVPASELATLSMPVEDAFGTFPEPTGKTMGAVRMDGSRTEGEGLKFVVADGSLEEEWVVDVPLLISSCREQGDFGPPGSFGQTVFAWPLSPESFRDWMETAGVAAADELWRLYNRSSATPRQMWNQVGTDLTLFCGLRAAAATASTSRASPVYTSIFTFAVPFKYMGFYDVLYAAEGIDSWLLFGASSASTVMGVTLSDEAIAVGNGFRRALAGMARTGSLGRGWKPHPAVCEYGRGLDCSEANAHARACTVFDEAFGRKFDFELG
jgi:carboxylesterase type B